MQTGTRADFKSFYEPGGALHGQKNLKNCTWADFRSLYEPGGALRGHLTLLMGIRHGGAWELNVGAQAPWGGLQEG